MTILIVVAAVVAVIGAFVLIVYNRLVRLRSPTAAQPGPLSFIGRRGAPDTERCASAAGVVQPRR